MKLGFWTVGMPQPLAEIATMAADLGFDGVDVRCTRPVDGKPGDQGNLCIETPTEELDRAKAIFGERHVEIASLLCYHPGGHGNTSSDWKWFGADVARHAELAAALGAPLIRPAAGSPAAGTSWESHLSSLFSCVRDAISNTPSVGAVFENHPGAASARQLLETASRFADPRLGVIYSPDHILVMQEDPFDLIDRYAPFIREVSYADRRVVAEDLARFDGRYYYVRYESCLSGEGAVPAQQIFDRLATAGFDGYVSLKWEKSERFGQHLPPHDVALPQFLEFVAQFQVRTRQH